MATVFLGTIMFIEFITALLLLKLQSCLLERKIHCQHACHGQGWAKLKLGTGNTILFSHIGGRDPSPLPAKRGIRWKLGLGARPAVKPRSHNLECDFPKWLLNLLTRPPSPPPTADFQMFLNYFTHFRSLPLAHIDFEK